jgi:tetratricopeptide (TPR) repeat protein
LSAFLLFTLLKWLFPSLTSAPKLAEKANPSAAPGAILAFLVALVWVVHPIHNAAVAYIAGRADSLACIFAISAWLLYIQATRSAALWAKCALQGLALFCCFLALCSKEIAIIWVALFVFHLFIFDSLQGLRKKFGALVAICMLIGIYVYMRNSPGGGAAVGGGDPRGLSTRIILMLRALGDYTWLIFYPDDLHMERIVFTTNAYKSLVTWERSIRFEYLSVIGAGMLAAFIYMARSNRPGRRLRIFAILWFFVGFLPISNLFPLNAQAAEHWIYMPSMGFLLFLAGCLLALPRKYHFPAACVAVLAVIPFTTRTWFRSKDWADSERFYRQTIMAGSGSTRINLNLALVYSGRGDLAKAESLLRDIVKRFPDYMPARINLGINLHQQGKDKEAEEFLNYDRKTSDTIAKQYTHTWKAAQNLAQIRFEEKKYDESLAMLDDGIQRHPDVWELVQFKAEELKYLGRLRDAIRIVKGYTDSHWWHYPSHMMLAHLELADSETGAGIAALQHAAVLDIHACGRQGPYNTLAQVYLNLKQPEEAYHAQMKAIQRDPNQPLQYIMLAHILDLLNRKQESGEAIKHAEELRNSVSTPGNRG